MTILDHIKALFRGGLDGILSDLNRTVARLESHAGYQAGLAQAAYNNAITHRNLEQDNIKASIGYTTEANKTLQIKARIAALVA